MSVQLTQLAAALSKHLRVLFPEHHAADERYAARSRVLAEHLSVAAAEELSGALQIAGEDNFLFRLTGELARRFGVDPLLKLARAARSKGDPLASAELDGIIADLETLRPPPSLPEGGSRPVLTPGADHVTLRRELARFLSSAFSLREVQQLTRKYSFLQSVHDAVNWDTAFADMVDQFLRVVEQRGLVSEELFDILEAERPRRAAEIGKLRALYAGQQTS
jgi:hypothetical protein